MVSPVSDPKKSRFWTVISGGCSSDPSLTLEPKDEEEEEAESDGELEEEKEEMEELEKVSFRHGVDRGGREAPGRHSTHTRAEQETRPARFSFILRPVYNDSMQFLHCSLRLCVSDSKRGEPIKETVKTGCEDGIRIPPLVSRSTKHQVQKELTHRSHICHRPNQSQSLASCQTQ